MIGVSSCLAGVKCTFRGDDNLIEIIKEMVARKRSEERRVGKECRL